MQEDQSTQNPRGIDPVVTIVPESGAADLARSCSLGAILCCSLGAILGKVGITGPGTGAPTPPEDEETKLTEANHFRNLADILAELPGTRSYRSGRWACPARQGTAQSKCWPRRAADLGHWTPTDRSRPPSTTIPHGPSVCQIRVVSCTFEAASGVEPAPETAILLPNDPQYPD